MKNKSNFTFWNKTSVYLRGISYECPNCTLELFKITKWSVEIAELQFFEITLNKNLGNLFFSGNVSIHININLLEHYAKLKTSSSSRCVMVSQVISIQSLYLKLFNIEFRLRVATLFSWGNSFAMTKNLICSL